MLRYPGRLLTPGEFVPPAVVNFIGRQLDLDGNDLADYTVRSETRHEHLADLRRLYGFRSFSGRAARELGDRLREEAQRGAVERGLGAKFIDACRRTRTILPTTTTTERLGADALFDAERQIEPASPSRFRPGFRANSSICSTKRSTPAPSTVWCAVGCRSRGASTTDVMLAGNWKTSRMVAHYSAGATAERGAPPAHIALIGAPVEGGPIWVGSTASCWLERETKEFS